MISLKSLALGATQVFTGCTLCSRSFVSAKMTPRFFPAPWTILFFANVLFLKTKPLQSLQLYRILLTGIYFQCV